MIVALIYDIDYAILAKKLNITYIYDFYLTVITVGLSLSYLILIVQRVQGR